MVRRLIQQMWLVLASLAAASSAPAMAEQRAAQRIVAVGDLHGDWQAWLAIARAARLVDSRGRWAAGPTTLVQLGDITDRGPDSLKIIDHLRRLQSQAPRSGGRVVVLVGNHEAMNLTGDLRYVHPGEYAAFADRRSKRLREIYFERNRRSIEHSYRARSPDMASAAIRQAFLAETPLGMIEHRTAWHPTGELGRWAIGNSAVVKIGNTLFVHGGLSAEYASLPIDEINRRVAAALEAREQALASIINHPLGPLWYRGNVTREGTAAQEIALASGAAPTQRPPIDDEIDQVLSAHGASRLVVGHTPSLAGIEIGSGGRLVRVDTGISRYYGGRLSFLEIVGDRLVPHHVDRPPASGASQR